MTAFTPTCPSCHTKGGALTADPHCASPSCTWNRCKCGTTYDRKTESGFRFSPKPVYYPAAS